MMNMGIGDADDTGNHNLTSFRENLEMMLSGIPNDEIKKLGIDVKLVQELSSTLKIIELTFGAKTMFLNTN